MDAHNLQGIQLLMMNWFRLHPYNPNSIAELLLAKQGELRWSQKSAARKIVLIFVHDQAEG